MDLIHHTVLSVVYIKGERGRDKIRWLSVRNHVVHDVLLPGLARAQYVLKVWLLILDPFPRVRDSAASVAPL